MDRRNFLKGFGLFSVLTPFKTVANTIEKENIPITSSKATYKFDELFYWPYEGNTNLIYVRNNSFLARKLYDNGIDEKFEPEYTCGTYYPKRDLYIPYKEDYKESDFDHLVSYLKNRGDWGKLIPFNGGKTGKSPMRFILNRKGFMSAEFLIINIYNNHD